MNKITCTEDLDTANLFAGSEFSAEQVENFKFGLLFRNGELLSANFNSLINKLATDGVDKPGQERFVIDTLKSFGIEVDEETFKRRYNRIFYGNVDTCQCRYAPGWYCNCC